MNSTHAPAGDNVARTFTGEQHLELRRLVRDEIQGLESLAESLSSGDGAPWASAELREQMRLDAQKRLAEAKALRRALL